MSMTVEDDNKVQSIIFLTDEASEFLNPREEMAKSTGKAKPNHSEN
jgi:hypothetical protein